MSFTRVWTWLRDGSRVQNAPLRILVSILCHKIPACSPKSVHHIGTEVPQIAHIATMAETFINCSRAGPTRPHTSPMELGHKNTFLVPYDKKLTGACFWTHNIQRVGSFLDKYDPMPLDGSKHWDSSWGGSWSPEQKLIRGYVYLDQIMRLQGVNKAIEPLDVGNAKMSE